MSEAPLHGSVPLYVFIGCCRTSMAHTRQSRPDSGLGFQVNFLKTVHGAPPSLGSGMVEGAGSCLTQCFIN